MYTAYTVDLKIWTQNTDRNYFHNLLEVEAVSVQIIGDQSGGSPGSHGSFAVPNLVNL